MVDDGPRAVLLRHEFQYSAASMIIHGVGRDAAYVAARIGRRHAGIRNRDRVEA